MRGVQEGRGCEPHLVYTARSMGVQEVQLNFQQHFRICWFKFDRCEVWVRAKVDAVNEVRLGDLGRLNA